MTPHEIEDDRVLASVASLRAHDVHLRRATDLRARCHGLLAPPRRRRERLAAFKGISFREVIGPAVGCLWCVVYLLEIIRRAAAAYRF